MASFQDQLQKSKSINESLVSNAMFEFIRSIEKEMTELNRVQLNEKSKDIFGDAIGFYSYATEVITGGRKKKGEPFDVYSTGNVLKKLYAKVEREMVVFGSTDSKVDLILNSDNWLSTDLFGLTDQDLEKIIEDKILPFTINHYRKQLDI